MEKGLVHLYWGEGKGKTTAAMGLALRALGHGLRVTVVQFLKDGCSGELTPLRELGAAVYSGMESAGFVFQMSGEEKASLREQQGLLLKKTMEEPCGLLILDEACAALRPADSGRSLRRPAAGDGGGQPSAAGCPPSAGRHGSGYNRKGARPLDVGSGGLFHGNALPQASLQPGDRRQKGRGILNALPPGNGFRRGRRGFRFPV